jgi:hypothetical protein
MQCAKIYAKNKTESKRIAILNINNRFQKFSKDCEAKNKMKSRPYKNTTTTPIAKTISISS